MKLVASVMVGPGELGRYLDLCVKDLSRYCDEIVCRVEADDEAAWLEAHGAVVVRADRPMFEHEGRARQQLLDATLAHEPTHVLTIDADEFVTDGPRLRAFAKQNPHPVMTGVMTEVWRAFPDCLCVREDGGWWPHPVTLVWKVPTEGQTLRIQDRQLACGREPVYIRDVGRFNSGPSGVSILHFGWANESERAARIRRYEISDGGRFHANSHLQSIGWPNNRVQMHATGWPPGLQKLRKQILARTGADRNVAA